MSTYVAKASEIERKWFVVDAEGKTLGRLATEISMVLMGKNKPTYTPFLDTGDFVIVVNAAKVNLTGNKWNQKMYRYHPGYPGGLKEMTYNDLRKRKPEMMVELAVKGMLPKSTLGRQMFKKLKVYAGPEHKQSAQQPVVLDI